jgi:hypothetical protein
MRKALNENPKVQIGLILGLLAIGAIFLMMRGGGGGSESATPSASTTTPAGAATTTPGTTSGAPAPAAGAAPAATTPAQPVATPTSELTPGKGLPAPVFAAYKTDDVVALLVVRRGGIDDNLVRQSVATLRGEPGVKVFLVDSRNVAKYAQITASLGVDRAPALVVLRPESLSHGVPQGEVLYAFRSTESIHQAVVDARYAGPERTYDP